MLGFSFRTKLLASHVGLVVAVVVIALLELNRTLVGDLHRQLDERLVEQARGAAVWVGEGRRHPDKLAGRLALIVKADVAIFDHQGTVLGDSSERAPVAPDDARAPEVTAAMRGEVGLASRVAPASHEEMRYVAVPAADGLVLRLGTSLADIHGTVLAMQRRLLFASGLAVALALAFGFLVSELAARPLRAMSAAATRLTRGDYDIELASTSPDEFGLLSRTLTTLASELKARIGDLTTERDRLSAILAGMAEGVLVTDRDGRILLANPAASEIIGAREPIAGATLDAAVADEGLRRVIRPSSGGGPHEADVETAEGKSITLYVRPLATAARGSVAVLRDMTRLRKLMTMRRDFVANVSHELRTPIAAIQGYAETLLSLHASALESGATAPGESATTQRQFLEIVHRQAQRLGALVADLLTLSELEARPEGAASFEPVDIAALAGHVVQTVSAKAHAASARVLVDVSADARAFGDPIAMEQVLQNLVDNALKYGARASTQDGASASGAEVRIRGRREGARVVVTVSDDGPGIAREHLPRLFERFYRVDAGRSRERGGTGLGLAIVKHLVESMGGRIGVDSEVSRGTTFRVELPTG